MWSMGAANGAIKITWDTSRWRAKYSTVTKGTANRPFSLPFASRGREANTG
jgi:hypothetical protein